jgi:ATP-dependent Clp protease ATP-binding subunit ClpA
MNEQKQEDLTTNHRYSPHELTQEILPELTVQLPTALCQHLPIVPFLPLHKSAIEKMLRLKLKMLGKHLYTKHGIELTYAPEVVRFLVKQVMLKQDENQQAVNIDKTIKPLYFIVEQTVAGQADNINRPNQLFLQLNETGQLLRCDWLLMNSVRHHSP